MMPYLSSKQFFIFDLDDTLYKEIDYLHSAYRQIADIIQQRYDILDDIYTWLLRLYDLRKNVFEELIAKYPIEESVADLLNIYRYHLPRILLSDMTFATLTELSRRGCRLGILTDGRSQTQRNKIAALTLQHFVEPEDILISAEFGSGKPDERNYRYFSERYPEWQCTYVADNPEKDFVAPNQLGWRTICLLDDGCNIHRQDFNKPMVYLPQFKIIAIEGILLL